MKKQSQKSYVSNQYADIGQGTTTPKHNQRYVTYKEPDNYFTEDMLRVADQWEREHATKKEPISEDDKSK